MAERDLQFTLRHYTHYNSRMTGPGRPCKWRPSAYPKHRLTPYSVVARMSPASLWLTNRWKAAIEETVQRGALRYYRVLPHALAPPQDLKREGVREWWSGWHASLSEARVKIGTATVNFKHEVRYNLIHTRIFQYLCFQVDVCATNHCSRRKSRS